MAEEQTATADSPRPGRHIIVFPLAVVLACLGLAAWEMHLRGEMVLPAIPTNTPYTPVRSRASVRPNSMVLVGSSSTSANFTSGILSKQFERPVTKFIRISSIGYEAYDWLAQHESFKGVVLVTVAIDRLVALPEQSWVKPWRLGLREESQKHWDQSLDLSPAKFVHLTLRHQINQRFSFRSPDVPLSSFKVLRALYDGDYREKVYPMWYMQPDMQLLFDTKPEDRYMKRWGGVIHSFVMDQWLPQPLKRGMTDEELDAFVARFKHNEDAIRCRGGEVVYQLWTPMLEGFDGSVAHEVFADFCRRSQSKCININTEPSLIDLYHPLDGLHLDIYQRDAFTNEYVNVLRRVLSEPSAAEPNCSGVQ